MEGAYGWRQMDRGRLQQSLVAAVVGSESFPRSVSGRVGSMAGLLARVAKPYCSDVRLMLGVGSENMANAVDANPGYFPLVRDWDMIQRRALRVSNGWMIDGVPVDWARRGCMQPLLDAMPDSPARTTRECLRVSSLLYCTCRQVRDSMIAVEWVSTRSFLAVPTQQQLTHLMRLVENEVDNATRGMLPDIIIMRWSSMGCLLADLESKLRKADLDEDTTLARPAA